MDNITKAVIKLENGDSINLDLYPDIAPLTVENFVNLARDKFYDGLIFHRVIPEFMIQGGGMNEGLDEKRAPKTIRGEFTSNGFTNPLHHAPGVISMARTNMPNSASSQFFICVADCAFLDRQYAAFGECSDSNSLATAIKISKVSTTSVGRYDDVPREAIKIETIEIL